MNAPEPIAQAEREVNIFGIKRGSAPEIMKGLAHVQGVDVEAIRAEADEAHKAQLAEEARAKAEAKKAAKKKAPEKKAAPAGKPATPRPPLGGEWPFPTPTGIAHAKGGAG